MTAGSAPITAAGADPAPLPSTVAALVDVNLVWPGDPSELWFGGRRIVWRPGRGLAPILAEGVSVWAGGFRRGRVARVAAGPVCVLRVERTPVGFLDWPGVTATPEEDCTAYERVGAKRVERLIAVWCARLLADPRLAGYVLRCDLRALRVHLRYLLLVLLDGPQDRDRRPYLWVQWRRRYVPLRIPVADFDLMVRHLAEALCQARVDEETARYLIGRVRSWRGRFRPGTGADRAQGR